MELTFFRLDEKIIIQHAAENRSHMGDRVFLTREKNEDIIQVDEDKLIEYVTEHVVNQGLADSRRVGQPKGHHQVLLMPCRCF